MDGEKKIAVLIDAENISSKYIKIILNEANILGSVIYKRIYGDWTNSSMSSWKKMILDNSIQPIQQYSYTTGKNATDSALIIDAMDLLFSSRLNSFCIISSDSDYTRLVSRLRESEMFVLGMGEQKTPRSLISACNKFIYLDLLHSSNSGATEEQSNTLEPKDRDFGESVLEEKTQEGISLHKRDILSDANLGSNIEVIKQYLQQLVGEKSDEDGRIFSGTLGMLVSKQFPDFDVRNFGHKKFFPFIMSLGMFEFERDEKDQKLIYFKMK